MGEGKRWDPLLSFYFSILDGGLLSCNTAYICPLFVGGVLDVQKVSRALSRAGELFSGALRVPFYPQLALGALIQKSSTKITASYGLHSPNIWYELWFTIKRASQTTFHRPKPKHAWSGGGGGVVTGGGG
jgi:hypothetical protein